MPTIPNTNTRRQFLQLLGSASALGLLSVALPAWARPMQLRPEQIPAGENALRFDLGIRRAAMPIAGGTGNTVSIDNMIPGPLLEWQEGRDVIINVTNHMRESTSIHWHGILLPFEMDGVPGVSFRGIEPGETFQYRFPVVQSGTYWYHSHSGLQEQSGAYGPLVIHPAGVEPNPTDRDYVVMLSDWTFDDPHAVMAKLKKMADFYNYQQVTVADLLAENDGMSFAEATRTKLAWDRMRMMPTDIADVSAAGFSYLMNGTHTAGNWTGLFTPGEKIRLRFVNGAAMSYFNVRIPGLEMVVVAADGQNVEPVPIDEFQIGVAETYDVVVTPTEDRAYTVMAESMDRSGFVAGTLAPRAGQRAEIPALREPPRLTMVDMGMDMENMDMPGMQGMNHAAMNAQADTGSAMDSMAGMDHSAMGNMASPEKPATSGMSGMKDMEGVQGMASMNHGAMKSQAGVDSAKGNMPGMDHSAMGNKAPAPTMPGMAGMSGMGDMSNMADNSPIIARHGPGMHGPGNSGVATVQRNRLGEPGTGLAEMPHRVLVYNDLRRRARDFDRRVPGRDLELHLTGNMERYMWSFDGVKFSEVDGPIEFQRDERLRLILVNDTMMNHPIHLHGMWMELENGQGMQIPRKHTINLMPGARVSTLISADAPGRWAFHCHLLYHMDMGMFRVVRVS